jgi:hypothetical protein
MSCPVLSVGLAPYLPLLPQRTASDHMRCLRMGTSSSSRLLLTGRSGAQLAPPQTPCSLRFERFNCRTFDRPSSHSVPGTLHFLRFRFFFPVSPSTHGAKVILVFPTKSLKIRTSGHRVSATYFSRNSRNFSFNARRNRLAFPRVLRPTRLNCKSFRTSFSSSSWRSL